MDSFSTGYVHVSDALLTQLTKISRREHDQDVSGRALAQAVAMVQGIAPRNETEAMLAVQMVAIHNAALATAARLGEANTREQQQAAVNSLSKLTCTFTAQVEVLKNGRLNGVQQIHVYHHRGEPSPVAAPEPPEGAPKTREQPHGPYSSPERRAPLHREIEAIAAGLPRPCREGT